MDSERKPHEGWKDDITSGVYWGSCLIIGGEELARLNHDRERTRFTWDHLGEHREWRTTSLDVIKLFIEDRLAAHYLRMASLLRPAHCTNTDCQCPHHRGEI